MNNRVLLIILDFIFVASFCIAGYLFVSEEQNLSYFIPPLLAFALGLVVRATNASWISQIDPVVRFFGFAGVCLVAAAIYFLSRDNTAAASEAFQWAFTCASFVSGYDFGSKRLKHTRSQQGV